MKNTTPTLPRTLIVLTTRAITGATSLELTLGIQHNRAADISADLYAYAGRPADPLATPPTAIPGSQASYAAARDRHAQAREALRDALADGRKACGDVIDSLKRFFGRRWNGKWRAVGFLNNSIAVPRNSPLATLMSLSAYLHLHPEHEDAASNVTAARLVIAISVINAAQATVDSRRAEENTALVTRDDTLAQLRRRITALRKELETMLGPDDVRWYRFGFQRPTDTQSPMAVEDVELEPGTAGTVVVRWSPSPRADNYRVTWRVPNAPADTLVGLFTDTTAIISGLTSATQVVVAVSARNATGETVPTEVTITVP